MFNYQNLSDNELIVFLREGNAAAYTEIYDRYFQLMFVFAYKKLRDEELSKDFVQELFGGIWEKRSDLLDNANFIGFLYISMRNKILNFFAHQKVEGKFTDYLEVYLKGASAEPSDYLIREKQLNLYIEKQIQQLPKKMRVIFELSRKEFLTHKEIASKLETSEHNVTKQITNALRIIKSKVVVVIVIVLNQL